MDTVDRGTASIGGGSSSCGSEESTVEYIGTNMTMVEDLTIVAVTGIGKHAEPSGGHREQPYWN